MKVVRFTNRDLNVKFLDGVADHSGIEPLDSSALYNETATCIEAIDLPLNL